MHFYEKFSKYYDDIFPFQKPQYTFLEELIESGDTVLDLACGTGNYIVELSKNKRIRGIGLDLDEKMVEKAKEKGDNLANLELYTENMLDFGKLNEKFDLIYCIGNSIPHLLEPKLIEQLISDAYANTKENGKIVLQTVNYDRKPQSLKTIINIEKNIKFVRNYQYRDDVVDFCTSLEGEDFNILGKVTLYPLKSQELFKMLSNAGYKEITFYGSFNQEAFNPEESVSLIVEARK